MNGQKIDFKKNQTAFRQCGRDKQQFLGLNSTFQSHKWVSEYHARTHEHDQTVVTWQHHFKVNRCNEEGVM